VLHLLIALHSNAPNLKLRASLLQLLMLQKAHAGI